MNFNEQAKTLQPCPTCGRPLPRSSNGVCQRCREERLFREVKEYVNENIATEFDVAEKFNIPLSKVRSWIHEGRIEYTKNFFYEGNSNDS